MIKLKKLFIFSSLTLVVSACTPSYTESLQLEFGSPLEGYDETAVEMFAQWGQGLTPRETYQNDVEYYLSEPLEIPKCLRFVGRLSSTELSETYETLKDLSKGSSEREVAFEDCLDGKINNTSPNHRLRKWIANGLTITSEQTVYESGSLPKAYVFLTSADGAKYGVKMLLENGIWKLN